MVESLRFARDESNVPLEIRMTNLIVQLNSTWAQKWPRVAATDLSRPVSRSQCSVGFKTETGRGRVRWGKGEKRSFGLKTEMKKKINPVGRGWREG